MPESRADGAPGMGSERVAEPGDAGESRSTPIVERVRDRLSSELNARKDRATEMLDHLAGTVRQVGEPLREGGFTSPLAEYADQAAGRIDQIAAGMRERDVTDLADDLRGLARRRPGMFAAAGFAAGLVAARFFKSSAAEQSHPTAASTPRAPRGAAAAAASEAGVAEESASLRNRASAAASPASPRTAVPRSGVGGRGDRRFK